MHFIALHRFILFLIELSKLIELIVFLLGVKLIFMHRSTMFTLSTAGVVNIKTLQ